MNTLLVSGVTLAGLVVGGVLDPVGQHLADLSQLEDQRRRAEHEAQLAAEAGGEAPAGADAAGPELAPVPLTDGTGAGVRPAEPEPVHNLLPAGRVPARTAAAAVVTGALFGAAAGHFGRDLILAPFCIFFAMLVVVSITDLSHRLVPRRIIYGGLALIVPLLVITSAVDHRWYSLSGSAVAGAVAFGIFFAIWWFVPRGMGFGDVRLAGVIGMTVGYLSLLHAYIAFLVGFVVGMVFGLITMVAASSGRKTRIPFAPSLSVGAVIAVFWGAPVAHSLFHVGS